MRENSLGLALRVSEIRWKLTASLTKKAAQERVAFLFIDN